MRHIPSSHLLGSTPPGPVNVTDNRKHVIIAFRKKPGFVEIINNDTCTFLHALGNKKTYSCQIVLEYNLINRTEYLIFNLSLFSATVDYLVFIYFVST